MANNVFNKRTSFKKNKQGSEEEGFKDYRLDRCALWIGNLDTEKVQTKAFEMWTRRNMEKISWKDHKTNEYVLYIVKERRKLLNIVLERKKRWLRHILRGESLVKEVTVGRMEGKKGRGKPRIMLLDDIKADETYEKIKRIALDRVNWRNWMSRTCFGA